ncbi:two-component system regulatory protein YycI [Bacillus niameyensis]|uniref:two-component system regulatory protein YycI n=1 Tax=Bacillus niameyensis TaxID=1522308 RepID=UPI000783D4A0|nr:two-component system regulatory protein YycI [Bacillus niameyensis]
MDWSRIKTIFIIAFLILDLFLLSQLLTKMEQYEVKNDAPIDENFKADGIKYEGLPKEVESDHYLSANIKRFTKEELQKLQDQQVHLENQTIVRSELETPIVIKNEEDFKKLDEFVKANVLYGDEYEFWEYNKADRTFTYYQKVDDKFLFKNQSAHLIFQMNEQNEIISYNQTKLEEIDPISEEEDVLQPLRVLEILYGKGLIKSNSTVKAELGYYTFVNMEAAQVLTPTWYFIIERDDGRESMLVNALEGTVIQSQPTEENKLLE